MFGQGADDLGAKMDADSFRSKMNAIAYGNVMAKAAEDYKQEMLAGEAAQQECMRQLDVSELSGDPELEKLHRDRLAELQREAEKRATLQRRGHGEYQEIQESDFLDAVTQTHQVVCHFFHRDFLRCKIVDKHLQQLAKESFNTRFIKLSAPDSPFFTEKLQVKMLPCIIVFLDGIATQRIVGFDKFGNRDDFSTAELQSWLLQANAIAPKSQGPALLPEHVRTAIRQGRIGKRDSDDEDSDFSD